MTYTPEAATAAVCLLIAFVSIVTATLLSGGPHRKLTWLFLCVALLASAAFAILLLFVVPMTPRVLAP